MFDLVIDFFHYLSCLLMKFINEKFERKNTWKLIYASLKVILMMNSTFYA